MTTPGEMVKCAAAALGLPEMTLTQIDRELVTNGLRSKGGRGRSAAKMTTGDVCNLLIGATCGGLVKDVAKNVGLYSSLRCNEVKRWALEAFPLPSVLALPEDHTFGQALQAFMDSTVSGELLEAENAIAPTSYGDGAVKIRHGIALEFRIVGPLPQAMISVLLPGQGREERSYSTLPRALGDLTAWSKDMERKGYGDLARMNWFTARTLREMAKFLNGGVND